jgi:cysteinyl-tRNA synthetase
VKYWLHSAHLIVEGKKMSKSLGNFYTLRQLLDRGYDPLAVRYVLISTHYRQQLNFTFDGLDGAKSSIDRLREFETMLGALPKGEINPSSTELLQKARAGFEDSLDDDLNISGAMGAVFELVREINKLRDSGGLSSADAEPILAFLRDFDAVTGLLPKIETSSRPVVLDGEEITIERAIELRAEARANKDWPRADTIRDAIATAGYIIKDTPDGTIWRIEG